MDRYRVNKKIATTDGKRRHDSWSAGSTDEESVGYDTLTHDDIGYDKFGFMMPQQKSLN